MSNMLSIFLVLGVILISIVLHELAHGLIAYWLGDDTAKEEGRLTLNPFKHLDLINSFVLPLLLYISGGPIFGGAKPVPINTRNLRFGAWGMALVAIAGPLTNFLIALISFLIGHFTGLLYANHIGGFIITELVFINLGFGIFNLIPIPPLDGSRVIYALAPDAVRNFMNKMESFGIWIVLGLVVIFGSIFSSFITGATTAILNFFYLLVGG